MTYVFLFPLCCIREKLPSIFSIILIKLLKKIIHLAKNAHFTYLILDNCVIFLSEVHLDQIS